MSDREYKIFLEIEKHLLNDEKPSIFLTKLAEDMDFNKKWMFAIAES